MRHAGDNCNAFINCKASVSLLVHESATGAMSPFVARHLRRLGRAAADEGRDGTDYTRSYTARSFVPYFGQRISTACVMFGAEGTSSQEDPQATKATIALRRAAACV